MKITVKCSGKSNMFLAPSLLIHLIFALTNSEVELAKLAPKGLRVLRTICVSCFC